MPRGKPRSNVVAVRLEPEEHAQLLAKAEAEKVSIGEILRRGLSRELRTA
jgi:predicted HicB family RNase H-like nuclease